MLRRLRDRALGLAQRARCGLGRVGERAAERGDEEGVRLLAERERGGLAGGADDAAGGAAGVWRNRGGCTGAPDTTGARVERRRTTTVRAARSPRRCRCALDMQETPAGT